MVAGNCSADFPACRQAGEPIYSALTQKYVGRRYFPNLKTSNTIDCC